MVKSVKWTLCPPTESTARGEHQTRLLWTISAVHCNLKERLHHSHSTVTPLTFHLAPGMQETRLTRQIHRSFHGFFHFFPWFHKVCKDRVPTPQYSASRIAQCPGQYSASTKGSAGSPPQRRAWRLAPRYVKMFSVGPMLAPLAPRFPAGPYQNGTVVPMPKAMQAPAPCGGVISSKLFHSV
jgi:hypothetical protein